MVLFTSLVLAKDLFVPITVVGYLYLGLTYGAYPYLIKWLVPEHIRGISMADDRGPKISRSQKLTFAVVACTLLCLLFPVAAPLFFSLFLGVAVRESGIDAFTKLLGEVFLYGATFFLGLTLGVLCEANTLLEPTVLKLLLLGMLALDDLRALADCSAVTSCISGRAASSTRSSALPASVACRRPPRSCRRLPPTPTPAPSSCRRHWVRISAE
jgi:Na+-transporting methylmalonyl-CoA/oxaloacetate decarboxylase beta subunit